MKDNQSLKSFWTFAGAIQRGYKSRIADATTWTGLPESEANTEGTESPGEEKKEKGRRTERKSEKDELR